jgi:hypothetical protein
MSKKIEHTHEWFPTHLAEDNMHNYVFVLFCCTFIEKDYECLAEEWRTLEVVEIYMSLEQDFDNMTDPVDDDKDIWSEKLDE